jgi:hypothetical protein
MDFLWSNENQGWEVIRGKTAIRSATLLARVADVEIWPVGVVSQTQAISASAENRPFSRTQQPPCRGCSSLRRSHRPKAGDTGGCAAEKSWLAVRRFPSVRLGSSALPDPLASDPYAIEHAVIVIAAVVEGAAGCGVGGAVGGAGIAARRSGDEIRSERRPAPSSAACRFDPAAAR